MLINLITSIIDNYIHRMWAWKTDTCSIIAAWYTMVLIKTIGEGEGGGGGLGRKIV